MAIAAIWHLCWRKQKKGIHRRLLNGKYDVGASANQHDLPRELRHKYEALKCIGFGRTGVVLEATSKDSKLQNHGIVKFAIKLNFPKKNKLSAANLIKLDREVLKLYFLFHCNFTFI